MQNLVQHKNFEGSFWVNGDGGMGVVVVVVVVCGGGGGGG